MIIKFRAGDEWHLFDEVDSLRYVMNPSDGQIGPQALDFRQRPCRVEQAIGEKVLIIFMNKNQTAETEIVTYGPIYLMNNQGRTVETI